MKHLLAVLLLLAGAAGVMVVVPVERADAQTGVVLNEVQTSNQTTLTDASGETPDWIELLNGSGSAVDLTGWGLSDDAGDPFAWQFPAGTSIAPGSMLMVFASGTGVSANGELHTNFKLSTQGEFLGLYSTTGTLVSSFNPIPAMVADVSWGVGADGVLNLFDPATPGAPNGTGSLGFVGDVDISPGRGFYSAPVSVSMTAEAGTTIYYTLDGSAPSPVDGAAYTGAITISQTTVLRAVAVRAGWTSPRPVTSTYVFADDVADQPRMDAALAPSHRSQIVASLLELPTISLTTTDDANVPRFEWSQIDDYGVAVEMIHPDGSSGFQVDAGAHEVGGHSTLYPKDSLRLVFDAEWGESELDYPVFAGADNVTSPAATSFKRLTLRMGAHDTGFYQAPSTAPHRSFVRAPWHDETMLDLGHPGIHNRYVHVFLNGEYWGLHQLREHPDDHFMVSYFGGDNDQYLGVNAGVVSAGTGTSWQAVEAAAGSWESFSQLVDPINYIDFMLMSEYGSNNWDLTPTHNWRAAGPVTAGAGGIEFQFFHSDPDIAMVSVTASMSTTGDRTKFTGPAGSWNSLVTEAHPAFLELVEERAEYLLLDGGALSPEGARQRWDQLAAQIDNAIHAEYARWGTFLSPAEWQNSMDWFRDVYFPARADRTIEILQDKGLLAANPGGGLDAPTFSPAGGAVAYGTQVSIDALGQPGVVWYTTDGSDPRAFDGTAKPGAMQYSGAITVASNITLHARILDGTDWSPPLAVSYSLSAPAGPIRVIVNEFNAVSSSNYLGGGGAGDIANGTDPTLGRVLGNGGDWFELVVLEEGLDLRGWTFEIWNEDAGISTRDAALTMTSAAELSSVRAGTIITISESIADDVSFDPMANDWHINLQANAADQGAFITAASQTNFAINKDNTQIAIIDAAGLPAALATGEGTAPQVAVSGTEVFKLEASPDATIGHDSAFYADGISSSWGQPNSWSNGVSNQDLSALRFIYGDVNCSGTITIADAVVISQAMVGLRTDSAGCPMADPSTQINMVAADTNNTDSVTIADAVLVAQCTAQLTNVLCP